MAHSRTPVIASSGGSTAVISVDDRIVTQTGLPDGMPLRDCLAVTGSSAAPASALRQDADLAPLRHYWHPVAYSHEVEAKPLPVTVLGEELVVVRSEGGVRAFRDLCPHRGSRLSMGTLRGDRLVCPYHGFEYDAEGRCRRIPSQPADRQVIPERLRLARYEAAERYEIVWVALDEPRQPLPAIPPFDDPEFHVHTSPIENWETSAARWMENFLDITHFAHIHPGILADPDDPVCEPYEVHQTPTGLRYEYDTVHQFDPMRWPSEANEYAIDVEPGTVRTELFLPFTVVFENETPEGMWLALCAGLPVTASRVRFFTVQARNGALREVPDDAADELGHVIAEQDRPISESQRPELLPVDLTEEVHLRVGDAIGIAYRRRLREMGLTYA